MREQEIAEFRRAFSYERLTKYREAYCGPIDDAGDYCGYGLYIWNSRVGAEFFMALQVFEVVLRNAIAEACEAKYGPNWMYQKSFYNSLKRASYDELYKLTDGFTSTVPISKQIPELTLFFWQGMTSQSHYHRIWKNKLFDVFPNLKKGVDAKIHLEKIYSSVEKIRLLRNRIAHHEPIFNRNLNSDMGNISSIIKIRSIKVNAWLLENIDINKIISNRP